MIQIDKHIPPPSATYRQTRYPFADMSIGDSFKIAASGQNVRSAACMFASRHGGKFRTRKLSTGEVRVWRIA